MSVITAQGRITSRLAASIAGGFVVGSVARTAAETNPRSPIARRDFSRRNLQPERMDAPGLDPAEHALALAGLRRLNGASRTVPSVWSAIEAMVEPPTGRPLRVLDIACGGGGLARGLWHRARRAGVDVEVHGVDLSPTAVAQATAQTPASVPVSFSVADALHGSLPEGYDAVTSTLFLHHLTSENAAELLRRMADAAGQGVVVSDLRRSAAGYWLAQLACRTLSRSPIVHFDGPLSVEGAFTVPEFQRLASEAGLPSMRVKPHWPQRLLATWRREGT